MTAVHTSRKVSSPATAAKPREAETKHSGARQQGSPIDQALALRDMLRDVARQAGDLARALKQQKRQARIVATTLASLKELQKVAA